MLVSCRPGRGAYLYDMLHANLKRRQAMQYVIVQIANTYKANSFWSRRVHMTKEAKMLHFLLYVLHADYRLSMDVHFAMATV